ncbi:hypothetical protein IEQ34_003954 [Dendrobium chrysotoxum]|uniref:DUF4220 domain-containing protein n=1 Tax=Dendrobium chrysotoxum TaxID=161865 RepID=A0AAV7HDL8_DENCH|nr:hypothetical protein IEQ34_003954 [Dendrobium chrysotoxum]
MLVWSSYLVANRVADFVLGQLSNAMDDSSSKAIIAFWATFLILHLGGPDTITAYSMEDNDLWPRHLVSLIYELIIAFYVLVLSKPTTRLIAPTMLIFLVAIIKYVERSYSLYKASTESFHSSIESSPKKSPINISLAISNKVGLNALNGAFGLYSACKPFFLDLYPRVDLYLTYSHFFEHMTAKDILKVIGMELSYVYDELYVKADVTEELQDIITTYAQRRFLEYLKESSEPKSFFALQEVIIALNWVDPSFLKHINALPFNQQVLVCYISPELCFNWKSEYLHPLYSHRIEIEVEENKARSSEMEVCKYLSKYLMYMVLMQPDIMSTMGGSSPLLFKWVCDDMVQFYRSVDNNHLLMPTATVEEVCREMLTTPIEWKEDPSFFYIALMLAHMMLLIRTVKIGSQISPFCSFGSTVDQIPWPSLSSGAIWSIDSNRGGFDGSAASLMQISAARISAYFKENGWSSSSIYALPPLADSLVVVRSPLSSPATNKGSPLARRGDGSDLEPHPLRLTIATFDAKWEIPSEVDAEMSTR